ncbi:hypothetical protein [Flavobacterium sandaracinum]|uniref:Uncharacterized protein n=1 Tax=Flavobacterium sandaracinum TaxID=2541733 RepID=A0A4R5CZC3_9FLAO|nr:hypothetical protein [Flavobacterium sandaracinum]TDE03974.1 hypothetical protein E0F91_10100 [Flavobacterium sandaracinum]
MKIPATITAALLTLFLTSCVQKTFKKTVVFQLDASDIKGIKNVSINGKDQPLSWKNSTDMKVIKKDSLYELTTTFETGYTFTEVKFMVNDSLEFNNQDNRRVNFAATDTTFYEATFNKR